MIKTLTFQVSSTKCMVILGLGCTGQSSGLELAACGSPRNESDCGRGKEEKRRRRGCVVSTQHVVWSSVSSRSLTRTQKEREAGIFPKR